MTTVVIVRKNGVACIAADTLTTAGPSKESADFVANHDKLLRVGSTWLAVTGSASADHVLRSYFGRPKVRKSFKNVQDIFETLRAMQPILKKEYFINPREEEDDPYESSQFSCLIANATGIYGVDSMRGVAEYTRFYALGTGGEYAIGAMHALYDRLDTAEELARAALDTACAFDSRSAMPCTLRTIRMRTDASPDEVPDPRPRDSRRGEPRRGPRATEPPAEAG